jgi:diguanylate cyclase (GGDEF)-like protein
MRARVDQHALGATPGRRLLTVVSSVLFAAAVGIVLLLTLDDLSPITGSSKALRRFFDIDLSSAMMVLVGMACVLRAAARRCERLPWALVGLGIFLWGVGNTYFNFVLGNMKVIPEPSWADAGFLSFYVCLVPALAVLARRRVSSGFGMDASIAAAGCTAVLSRFVVPAVVHNFGGDVLANLTNLAYVGGDLLLVALVLATVSMSGWRTDRGTVLMVGGLVVFAISDLDFTYATATNTYHVGTILDDGWLIAGALVAAAAWIERPLQAMAPGRRNPLVEVAPSAGFALAGLAVLVGGSGSSLSELLSTTLAVVAVVLVIVRMVSLLAVNTRLLAQREREATTDALTGLGNRRRLFDDLERVDPTGRWTLALLDLDGFKQYNDTFGHPAGDGLLRRLGARLLLAIGEHGRTYRLGGDEFCVLTERHGAGLDELLEDAVAALSEDAGEFQITASAGWGTLGEEPATGGEEPAGVRASGPVALMRVADERLYASKFRRRHGVIEQVRDMLMQTATESDPRLHEHLSAVGRLAVAVACQLGLDEDTVSRVQRVAQFHDIGKLAIPDEVLMKPGPLTRDEWDLMRRHTQIAERIIAAVPALRQVAGMVRSTAEWWDGSGYPDGLAGEEIPIEARIVTACDALDAITSDRPYRSSAPLHEALAGLVARSRTQFDPKVVGALLAVVGDERRSNAA